VSSAPLKRVVSVLIYGKDQFVDGREVAIRATCAVVKDKKVAGPVQALRDPIGAMLTKKLLIVRHAGAIGARVAPAIEQIAASAPPPAAVPRRLGRGSAVINNPHLIKREHADDDLIQLCVVGD